MALRSKIARLALGPLAIGLLFSAGIAWTQDAPPPPRSQMFRGGGADDIGFVGFEAGIAGKTVTGAPFTANVSTEVSRKLADGNTINRTTSGSVARDSQGRVRRDMSVVGAALATVGGSTPPKTVFINDPVAGKSYILHPDSKTAEQLPARRWGRNAGARNGVRNRPPESNVVTTDLGTQTINGVLAQGTRTTRTIPAGQIGNEKPIVIVTERWYSPDLQTYVMTKRTDPLMGEVTFQLTNIERQEPDAALFEPPSDYTVRQGRFRGPAQNQQPPSQP
ncbi:MAG TPA: hypothetical protein VEJ67_11345 [Candidatus Cybelea sp.]|nr:hypothetical protein [Candidatus Cybelea sp.]